MTNEQEKLVKAVFQDARETWTSLTWDWLKEEAEKQIAGSQPTGGPGVFLNDYLRRAGISQEN